MVKLLSLTLLLLIAFTSPAKFLIEGINQEEITHSIGDIIVIQRHGIPTTGFQWFWISRNSYDMKVLQLIGEKFIPNMNRFGAPGIYEWKFKAIAEGETTLTFRYSRNPNMNGEDYDYYVIVNK